MRFLNGCHVNSVYNKLYTIDSRITGSLLFSPQCKLNELNAKLIKKEKRELVELMEPIMEVPKGKPKKKQP